MGSNTYLKDVVTYGWKTITATAAYLQQGIPGNADQRIAVKSFSFTCGNNVSTVVTFLQTIAETNAVGVVSMLQMTSINILSNAIGRGVDGAGHPTASVLTAGDRVCFVQDDGVYHFTNVHSVSASVITISTVFTDSVASNNVIYGLGAAADVDQMHLSVKHATETVKSLEGGLYYGKEKGYPMMLEYLSLNTSSFATLNYLTVQYINS